MAKYKWRDLCFIGDEMLKNRNLSAIQQIVFVAEALGSDFGYKDKYFFWVVPACWHVVLDYKNEVDEKIPEDFDETFKKLKTMNGDCPCSLHPSDWWCLLGMVTWLYTKNEIPVEDIPRFMRSALPRTEKYHKAAREELKKFGLYPQDAE